MLLVAEAKAFINMYHTLSAAGIIAVQLDRDRKLPMAAHTAAAAAAGSSSGADPAAQAAWVAGVQSAQSAASCVLATHEQLHHPCMALQGFHVLIEYIPWEHTATGAAAGGVAGTLVTDSSRAAVHAYFGTGKHFIFAVQKPNLAQAAAEAERAAAQSAVGPADAVADKTARRAAADRDTVGQAVAARAQQQPAPAHAAAAAAAASTQQAAAQGAAAATEEAPGAGQEVPLVLNISPGSLVKRRQSLYQSLMQLELHGYVLVERALAGSSRGGQATGAAGLVGAAVNVVLTPRACLCIWDESKLPQVRLSGGTFGQLWLELLLMRTRYACTQQLPHTLATQHHSQVVAVLTIVAKIDSGRCCTCLLLATCPAGARASAAGSVPRPAGPEHVI